MDSNILDPMVQGAPAAPFAVAVPLGSQSKAAEAPAAAARPSFLRAVPSLPEDATAAAAAEPAAKVAESELPGGFAELRQLFDQLRAEGRQAAEKGDLERAFELVDRSVEVARRMEDPEALALATCNRGAVAIMMGRFEELADLRAVLVRNWSVETSFIAAYNLSHAYELRKEFKKALFYAQVARDRAEGAGRSDYLANSLNQIGNCLLGDSYFQQAADEYQRALCLMPAQTSLVSTASTTNRSYCMLVMGRKREPFGQLFRSLRWLRRRGLHLYETWPHLFLCYGYLELGRLRRAYVHGKKALAIAERTGEYDAKKNALFLLAEVEKAAGETGAAYELLVSMQREFYPNDSHLAELMSVVEMKQLVNLRA